MCATLLHQTVIFEFFDFKFAHFQILLQIGLISGISLLDFRSFNRIVDYEGSFYCNNKDLETEQ